MTEPRLTARQAEVLEMLLAGTDRPAIRRALNLSHITVDHICEALLHAYSVPTVTVLVATVLGDRLARCEEARRAIEERTAQRRRGPPG